MISLLLFWATLIVIFLGTSFSLWYMGYMERLRDYGSGYLFWFLSLVWTLGGGSVLAKMAGI